MEKFKSAVGERKLRSSEVVEVLTAAETSAVAAVAGEGDEPKNSSSGGKLMRLGDRKGLVRRRLLMVMLMSDRWSGGVVSYCYCWVDRHGQPAMVHRPEPKPKPKPKPKRWFKGRCMHRASRPPPTTPRVRFAAPPRRLPSLPPLALCFGWPQRSRRWGHV